MKNQSNRTCIFHLLIFLFLISVCKPISASEIGQSLEMRPTEGGKNVSKFDSDNTMLLEAKSRIQNLPQSDVPFFDRQGRILTGPDRTRRAQTIELRTSLGVIAGTAELSGRLSSLPESSGRRFYAFRGIPYAKPPIGPLRWADPHDLNDPWPNGRLDATRHKSFCPQYDHDKKTVVGNEDCLYLNIYTPSLPGIDRRTTRLPVLVFIHGGAYTRGASSSHGPERLMREDIVLITINYRLGVLGLLSTNDAELPGNYAALDQISALRWIRRHVGEFGGDSDVVTLGGFSAGAGYVHLHTMSPLSQGLFHRAILMSGAGNCIWSVQNDPWEIAEQLGEDLGCSTSSSAYLKECLLMKDTESLLQAQAKRSRYVYWPFEYRPVVDAYIRDNPFLPAPIHELQREPFLSSSVPVLIGGTAEEGILFALTVLLFSDDSSNPKGVFDRSSFYLFESLWPNISSSHAMAEALVSFYYSENARKDMDTFVAETTDAVTDLLFTSCIWDAATSFASFQNPVYTYLMTHHDEGSPSFAAPLYRLAFASGVTSPLLKHGVSHGDDVILIFNFPYILGDMGPRDLQMSLLLTSMVGSFVRTGNPQDRSSLLYQFPPWAPIKPGEPAYYYRLSLNPTMIKRPYKTKERNMWQQTLPLLEEISDRAQEGWAWQIAFWVLFSILFVLFIVALIIGYLYLRSKRSKQYPSSGATLRSQIPRPTSTMHTY